MNSLLDDVLAFAGLIFFNIVMGVTIYALGPDIAALVAR